MRSIVTFFHSALLCRDSMRVLTDPPARDTL
jgi:hypothetical protein